MTSPPLIPITLERHKPDKPLRGNALRQRRYRASQIDSGRLAVKVWIVFETLENLRALAYKRKQTMQQALEAAINGEWESAGRP